MCSKVLPLDQFCAYITSERYGKQLLAYFKGVVPLLQVQWVSREMHHPVHTNETITFEAIELLSVNQVKVWW